jgi:hypothetical protein
MPADALAAIAKDHIGRGVSCGVVLGVNDVSPNYAHGHFWLDVKPMITVYPSAAQVRGPTMPSGTNR